MGNKKKRKANKFKNKTSELKKVEETVKEPVTQENSAESKAANVTNTESKEENKADKKQNNKKKNEDKDSKKTADSKSETKNKKKNVKLEKENKSLKNKVAKLEQENKELKEHILKIEKAIEELTQKVNALEEEKRLKEEKRAKFRKRLPFTIIQIALAIVIIVSAIYLIKSKIDASKTTQMSDDLKQYIQVVESSDGTQEQTTQVNFAELKNINSDTKAWVQVNGVNIDFPVVQSNDNKYYLTHNFDKTSNRDGWVYFDYRNTLDGTDKNLIIYGHNRRNGTMFSSLVNILNSSWYDNDENKYIHLYTEEGEITYEVFSIYQIEAEDYYIQTSFASDEEYASFLEKIKSRSVKNYDVTLSAEDSILTLSTCGNNSKNRVVLHAKKI